MSGYRILTLHANDPAFKQYYNMVHSDWLRSARDGNPWFTMIDHNRYFQVYGKFLKKVLLNPLVIIRLAVLSDDADTCLGWCVSEGDLLHYVFVKTDFRKQKIGTELLPKHFNKISHVTVIGFNIWKRKFNKVKCDPFI